MDKPGEVFKPTRKNLECKGEGQAAAGRGKGEGPGWGVGKMQGASAKNYERSSPGGLLQASVGDGKLVGGAQQKEQVALQEDQPTCPRSSTGLGSESLALALTVGQAPGSDCVVQRQGGAGCGKGKGPRMRPPAHPSQTGQDAEMCSRAEGTPYIH